MINKHKGGSIISDIKIYKMKWLILQMILIYLIIKIKNKN